MENHDDVFCIHESRKRKIDEMLYDSDGSNETVVIKRERDEEGECMHNDIPSIHATYNGRNIDGESQVENRAQEFTDSNISIIPTVKVKKRNNYELDDYEIVQDMEETIGWNCLVEKIQQLEDAIIRKMRSEFSVIKQELEEKMIKTVSLELSTIKKSWEENSCKCKYAHQKESEKFTSKIELLTQEVAQCVEQKQALMIEKADLEKKLKVEQGFRVELSGMLKEDRWKRENGKTDKFKHCDELKNRNKDKKSCSPPKINRDVTGKIAENRSTHRAHESRIKKDSKPEISKGISSISKSLRDKMPVTLSVQNLAEEIKERRERRLNIIMRGMRISGANLIDEVSNVIRKRTGVTPHIIDIIVMESYLLLQMASRRNKIDILMHKSTLRPCNITLHNDLTLREHQVQTWLREVAEEDEKLGKKTEIKFFKIKRDGVWKVWNERCGDLIDDDRTRGKSEFVNDT